MMLDKHENHSKTLIQVWVDAGWSYEKHICECGSTLLDMHPLSR